MTAVSSDAARARPPATLAVPVPARVALAGIVAVSSAVHVFLTWLRLVPTAFPDEYLYSALGRSLATGHGLSIRGGAAHFPALLQPLVTAPLWLLPGVEAPYRAVQALNATAMSLAAVPAYLIARRLRLGKGASLAMAALAVAPPQLALASQVLSEPIAYPLVLGAVAAGVALVERPSARRAALFFALSALATLARLQFAILPLCVLAAIVGDGLRERNLRGALRRQRPLLAVVGLGAAAAVALVAGGRLGYYQTAAPSGRNLLEAAKLGPLDLYVVLLSAGALIAPAALVGAGLALARPRFRAEAAFGIVVVVLSAGLLAEATLYGDTNLIQERYVFYLVPLAGIFFALRVSRRERRLLAETGAAAMLAALAAAAPLAGYVAAQSSPAAFEGAVRRLQLSVGDAGSTSLLIAVAATVLVTIGVAAVARSRTGTGVLAASVVVCLSVLAAAVSYERTANLSVRASLLPDDPSWVDHTHAGSVSLLAVPGTQQAALLETMFWNPSIEHVLLLPGAAPPDKFAVSRLTIADDGSVRPAPRGTLLVDESATTVVLEGVDVVRRWRAQTLLRTTGAVRVAATMGGRLRTGALFPFGGITVWPAEANPAGWVELRVRAARVSAGTFGLQGRGGRWHDVTVPAGESRVVRVADCGTRPWRGGFRAQRVAASVPRFVADASACS